MTSCDSFTTQALLPAAGAKGFSRKEWEGQAARRWIRRTGRRTKRSTDEHREPEEAVTRVDLGCGLSAPFPRSGTRLVYTRSHRKDSFSSEPKGKGRTSYGPVRASFFASHLRSGPLPGLSRPFKCVRLDCYRRAQLKQQNTCPVASQAGKDGKDHSPRRGRRGAGGFLSSSSMNIANDE